MSPAVSASCFGAKLPFALPNFVRLSWVSDIARETWGPRFQLITRAWSQMEWLSAAEGYRECALLQISERKFEESIGSWTEHGLSALRLQQEAEPVKAAQEPAGTGVSRRVWVAVGKPAAVEQVRRAFSNHDDGELGRLLGYPSCCRQLFGSWRAAGWSDLLWAHAAAAADCGADHQPEGASPSCNYLLMGLGLRTVPHIPCNLSCGSTAQIAEMFAEVARRNGFDREYEWLMTALSWSAEWSGLHGIAEIKTPVLKVITNTDATARKGILRWNGSTFPAEGANGSTFPYRAPTSVTLTSSPSFHRGLEQGASLVSIRPLSTAAS